MKYLFAVASLLGTLTAGSVLAAEPVNQTCPAVTDVDCQIQLSNMAGCLRAGNAELADAWIAKFEGGKCDDVRELRKVKNLLSRAKDGLAVATRHLDLEKARTAEEKARAQASKTAADHAEAELAKLETDYKKLAENLDAAKAALERERAARIEAEARASADDKARSELEAALKKEIQANRALVVAADAWAKKYEEDAQEKARIEAENKALRVEIADLRAQLKAIKDGGPVAKQP